MDHLCSMGVGAGECEEKRAGQKLHGQLFLGGEPTANLETIETEKSRGERADEAFNIRAK